MTDDEDVFSSVLDHRLQDVENHIALRLPSGGRFSIIVGLVDIANVQLAKGSGRELGTVAFDFEGFDRWKVGRW